MNYATLDDKDVSAGKVKYPLKKAHYISNKTLVVIDDVLVKHFQIDENTWFEQEHTEDGILLKIHRLTFKGVKKIAE
jgi:hypothetical protein